MSMKKSDGLELTDIVTNADSIETIEEKSTEIKGRGQWAKGIEFLLSCISLSVGLGNVWRFPHTAYEYGGGAFLIPYLIVLFIIGRPMYYLELVLGQFSGRGPIKVWKCVPAFKGIGFAQMFSTAYIIIFYNYLMALTLYYLFSSFQNPLPWTVCQDEWAPNGNCSALTADDISIATTTPNSGPDKWFLGDEDAAQHNRTWAELYYERHVLHLSSGLDDMNFISWRLVLCLMGSWTLVYLSIIKGVSSMGKVAYFTAIFPYAVLIALLGIALSMEGAVDGIIFFFKPKWERLLEPIVWYKAVEQSFFSLAICFGSLIMYSSYNEFHNNCYRDAIIIAILDTCTSLLAGMVIFANLGNLAKTSGKNIENVVEGGLGLAFVVYPQALGNIAVVPQLWSVLFFIMMFTLGIGSSVAQIETILTSIKDEFVSLHQRKELLALIACILFCILGLPLTTDAGTYVMELLDNYGVGTAVFFYGICQLVAIVWVYGLQRFCFDIKFMLNKSVGLFWKVTWGFAAPVGLIVIFIYGNVAMGKDGNQKKGIPAWGTGIGWALAAIAMVQIPLWIVITIARQKGDIRQVYPKLVVLLGVPITCIFSIHLLINKISGAFKPSADWGPINPKIRQEWRTYSDEHFTSVSIMGYINRAFTSSNNQLNTRQQTITTSDTTSTTVPTVKVS